MTVVAQKDAVKEATPTEAPAEENQGGPVMTLESDVVDYGTINQHGEPLRVLKFLHGQKSLSYQVRSLL